MFIPNNITLWSAAPHPTNTSLTLPQWWGYFTTDTIATVSAADYFNLGGPGQGLLISGSIFRVGDFLYCVCSDGIVELTIATIVGFLVTTAAAPQIIPAGSIVLAMLSAGITPAKIVKYGAQYTTLGGAAAEAIAIAGAVNTDLAFVQLVNHGPNTVSVSFSVVTANTLTVTFSGDPGAGTIINYQLLRSPS